MGRTTRHPMQSSCYPQRAVTRCSALLLALSAALSCTVRPAEPPSKRPEPAATEPRSKPEATAKKDACRDAYSLQLLTPDEHLGTPSLGTHAATIIGAAATCPPESADEAATLAIAHMVRDEHEAGARAAQRAVEFDPNSAFAYFARGLVASDIEDHVPAEADFRKALKLDPNRVEAHLELGLLLEAEGKVEAGRTSLARASEIRPQYILGSYYLALSLLEAQDVAAAGPHCEAVLVHDGDNDMFMCRGLARAAAGDYEGAIDDLEGLYGTESVDRFEEPIHQALRTAYLATDNAILAADHTCLEAYDLEGDNCQDEQVAAAVKAVRYRARQRATAGDFEATSKLSAAQFARELSKQAKTAKTDDDFIHPEIGVFVFYPYGWQMTRQTRWPSINAADRDLGLRALTRVTRLPKGYRYETNDLDCSYPLDSVIAPGDPAAFPTFYVAESSKVRDAYRLGDYAWFSEGYGDEFDEQQFEMMQRAALAITHHVIYAREGYEFGKIDGRWYLLAVSVDYDSEQDACG